MLLEILICALAAAAVLVLLWLLCAQFLLPVRTKNVWMLLVGQGDGATLEQDCRAYLLLKTAGALCRPLVIVDESLSEEGRSLAERLTSLDGSIRLCTWEELREQSPP